MDNSKINHVSLCTGYGGIDLGLRGVVRNLRTVAYCEIEAFVIANLVAKMEAGLMDAAPVWPNLQTFPFGKFRGLVDILSGGYPCQPWSAAGKRKGKDDPRHLWPWIADGIRYCEPRLCFFENVEGHVSLGLSTVVSDLEEMGYEVSWGIFSAAEVGAPHQRKRVFILGAREGWMANPSLSGLQARILHKVRVGEGQGQGSFACEGGEREDVADGIREGLEGLVGHEHDGHESGRIREKEDGSTGEGRIFQWPARPGQRQFQWEPPRTVGKTQSSLGGDPDGSPGGLGHAELQVSCDNRTDELRLLGNGVVPATATKAFSCLISQLKSY